MVARMLGRRVGAFLGLALLSAFGGGCADPAPGATSGMGGDVGPTSPGGFSGTGGKGIGGTGFAGTGGTGVGIDERPVVTAARRPPPISGGTLLALRAGGLAVASDPDRDRIVVVDTKKLVKRAELELEIGAEPGRLVEDAAGRVHVVLRGTGEVLTLDPASGELIDRRPVCRGPRGIAFEQASNSLAVACLEGTIVDLPAAGGEATRTTSVAPDLRDVVVLPTALGTTLVATRFRSAEVLYLDGNRAIATRAIPGPNVTDRAPHVAWRTVVGSDGKLYMAHQRSQSGEIDIGGGSGNSSYGFGGPCGAVVQATISSFDGGGTLMMNQSLDSVSLPVDIAVNNDLVAVANGAFDEDTATFQSSLSVFSKDQLTGFGDGCGTGDTVRESAWTTTAVAFDPVSGNLLAQTRQPSQIVVYDERYVYRTVNLEGVDVTDTGHQLFHADAGLGVACASCHAEGTDDGHVWQFSGEGPRRTQALDVGLEGTAPFHWDGTLPTFGDLMSEVFQHRMGGPAETTERVAALENYVYGMKRRPAARGADEAALRGKALFESQEVGCTGCHTGEKLTNAETKSIGKGAATQVPSLIGVSARLPLMHDGCATTLRDRFDPQCGGTEHGHPEVLDDAELSDLIAYLEAL
jgi:hypothetical protein